MGSNVQVEGLAFNWSQYCPSTVSEERGAHMRTECVVTTCGDSLLFLYVAENWAIKECKEEEALRFEERREAVKWMSSGGRMDEGNIVDGQSYQGPSSSNHKFRMRPVTTFPRHHPLSPPASPAPAPAPSLTEIAAQMQLKRPPGHPWASSLPSPSSDLRTWLVQPPPANPWTR